MPRNRSVPVPGITFDLAALFAGYSLSGRVADKVRERGFPELRFSHGFVIQHLIEGDKTIGALATAMGVTQQAVSQTVSSLQSAGYVERRTGGSDRRERFVSITEKGWRAVDGARAARAEVVAELEATIGTDRIEEATEVLGEVIAALGGWDAIRQRRVRPPD